MPPGDYCLLAFDATDPLWISDTAVLKTLLPRAEKAQLGKGVTVLVEQDGDCYKKDLGRKIIEIAGIHSA